MKPIDVDLGPNYKFVMLLVGVCTLGLGALVMWWTARSWPKRLDTKGITLRSGKRVLWSDLTDQKRVTVVDQRGRRITGRLELVFGGTKVPIVPQSLVQGPRVMDFLSQVLDEEAETG